MGSARPMSVAAAGVDLAPIGAILLVGLVLAAAPLAWVWFRERGGTPSSRLRALTLTTLFLTFDLVLFGAYTRLSDSGLGCPDWPGCYGSASPLGAVAHIDSAQAALPGGPVTHGKAWVEMTHRYLATAVGALITALAALSWIPAWRRRAAGAAPFWPTATLVWVCVQGAFGALTVTMKLYPAIVTLHLLGGIGLLVLLTIQVEAARPSPIEMARGFGPAIGIVSAIAALQIALGGWVSTNYAVLACSEFPTCQGRWWPPMDFATAFSVQRGLGLASDGSFLPFAALTAIHEAHRLGAAVLLVALVALAVTLARRGEPMLRRASRALVGVALWQVASGLSNVVLGWPLLAAVAHTGGAAALAVILARLGTRSWQARRAARSGSPACVSAAAAS
jgi:cytochrome c oxidase assembly protein subunit 15